MPPSLWTSFPQVAGDSSNGELSVVLMLGAHANALDVEPYQLAKLHDALTSLRKTM